MPNTTSAKKRLKQSLVRRARNRSAKSTLKTLTRRVLDTVPAGDAAKSDAEYRILVKTLDQAAARRIIHPNRAARVKSRVSARLKAAKKK